MRYLFGDYAIDAARCELCRAGEAIHVEPQVFDLLLHLVRNRDHVVSKDDLLASVWQGRIVSESTLASRINGARRAIGDSGRQQKFIRTVARRGFRFVGEVREEGSDPKDASSAAASPVTARLHPEPRRRPALGDDLPDLPRDAKECRCRSTTSPLPSELPVQLPWLP